MQASDAVIVTQENVSTQLDATLTEELKGAQRNEGFC